MKPKQVFDQDEFNEFQKMSVEEIYKKYKSLENQNKSLANQNKSLANQNKSLANQNKKKEAVIKQFMKEQIYFIDQDVYKLYDLAQSNEYDIKMKVDIGEKNSAGMLKEFKEYINKIDIKSDNIGSNVNTNKDENSSLSDRDEINKIIKHKFGQDLKINEFLKAFGSAIINNVNKHWIKDERISLKNYLEDVCDSEIKDIFYETIPKHIIQLRMDNLLSTVLNKDVKRNDKILDYLIIKSSVNYSLVPLNKGIEFINPENNDKLVFDKKYIIKQITNNVGIMNSYYKLIQKFVTNKFDKDQLKDTLIELIDKTNIYFCNMPKKVLGVTICNGDVFITGKFLQESMHNSPNNKNYNLTGVSKIFLTLLHEFAHKLQYTIRMKYNKDDNYFIKTFYFKAENDYKFDIINEIKIIGPNYNMNNIVSLSDEEIKKIINYKNLHGNKTRCESGDFFDGEIYLGKEQKSVTKSISKFFLLCACQKYNDFVSIMKSLLDKVDDPEERTTNSNYKLVDDEKVYCYFSYIRRNVLDD